MKNQKNLKSDVKKISKFSNGMKTIRLIIIIAAFLLIIPSFSLAATVTTFATLGSNTLAGDIVFDTSGNLYVAPYYAATNSSAISKITPSGTVTTFATLPAVSGNTSSLAFDAAGNLYAASNSSNIISKITPSGTVTTFATLPSFNYIWDIVFDVAGNLYAANANLLKISKITPSGTVTTFATLGTQTTPHALAFDTAGNLYSANGSANNISKITPSGTVSTFATVGNPNAFVFDAAGNLYTVNHGGSGVISKITPSGAVSTFATVGFDSYAIAFDAAGNLYAAEANQGIIKKITPSGTVTTIANTGEGTTPMALAFDTAGNLYTANTYNSTVSKISSSINVSSNIPSSWTITGPATITGSGTSQSTTGKPAGTYTIIWGPVAGYITPATQSLTLDALGAIAFSGTYSATIATPNCGTVTDVDGNTYETVIIGTQCWMKENLRTTKKPDGTSLTEGSGMYSNPAGYGSPWGRLYNWTTAMNIPSSYTTTAFDYSTLGLGYPAAGTTGMKIQGICPNGWHIPSDYTPPDYKVGGSTFIPNGDASDDFQKLLIYAGGSEVAGGAVKQAGTTNWSSPNTGANNSTGFTAIPAGFYDPSLGKYGGRPGGATFLSSYSRKAVAAKCYSLNSLSAAFFSCESSKSTGFSLRCVKANDIATSLTLSSDSGFNPVAYNTGTKLSWDVQNATWCWATSDKMNNDGGWTTSPNNNDWKTSTPNGTYHFSTGPLIETTTFTLKCGNGVDSTKDVTSSVLVCVSNCNDSNNYCPGPYTGNCGQDCSGSRPTVCTGSANECNKSCGGGTWTETCFCPDKTTTHACNSQPCPPGYKEVAPW